MAGSRRRDHISKRICRTGANDQSAEGSSPENVRRRKIDQYMSTNTIETGRLMELDSMFTTLDLVAQSDWATILPGILCLPDIHEGPRRVVPIVGPPLAVDYLRIEPMSQPLSDAGQAFYGFLMDELVTALDKLG